MRSLGTRLVQLRTLINLQCGPGAAILPPEVTRIHMDFSNKMYDGNMGAKKFWREYLPRLKFHNPAVPMIVNRHNETTQSPLMTIYLRKSASTTTDANTASESHLQPSSSRNNLSKAVPPTADERIVHVDMKNKHSSQILEYFVAETRAVPLQATPEELAEMQELERGKKQGSVDRIRVRTVREEKKREEDMLKRARAAGGMTEESA